jgi:hypothetical protein
LNGSQYLHRNMQCKYKHRLKGQAKHGRTNSYGMTVPSLIRQLRLFLLHLLVTANTFIGCSSFFSYAPEPILVLQLGRPAVPDWHVRQRTVDHVDYRVSLTIGSTYLFMLRWSLFGFRISTPASPCNLLRRLNKLTGKWLF